MKRIISLILCLVLGSLVLAGCSDNSQTFTQHEYAADIAEIKDLSIDVRDREIEVSLSEDNKIHITYFESDKESYSIGVSDGNALTMTSASNKEWTDYVGGKTSAENRKITVQIPNALLCNLTLSTTNEDINLAALTVTGGVNITSNGGDISFENLDVGKALHLNGKNGDIFGTVIGGYDDFSITSEIKKGESNLPARKDSGEKTLNVSNNNGDINIEFIK